MAKPSIYEIRNALFDGIEKYQNANLISALNPQRKNDILVLKLMVFDDAPIDTIITNIGWYLSHKIKTVWAPHKKIESSAIKKAVLNALQGLDIKVPENSNVGWGDFKKKYLDTKSKVTKNTRESERYTRITTFEKKRKHKNANKGKVKSNLVTVAGDIIRFINNKIEQGMENYFKLASRNKIRQLTEFLAKVENDDFPIHDSYHLIELMSAFKQRKDTSKALSNLLTDCIKDIQTKRGIIESDPKKRTAYDYSSIIKKHILYYEKTRRKLKPFDNSKFPATSPREVELTQELSSTINEYEKTDTYSQANKKRDRIVNRNVETKINRLKSGYTTRLKGFILEALLKDSNIAEKKPSKIEFIAALLYLDKRLDTFKKAPPTIEHLLQHLSEKIKSCDNDIAEARKLLARRRNDPPAYYSNIIKSDEIVKVAADEIKRKKTEGGASNKIRPK